MKRTFKTRYRAVLSVIVVCCMLLAVFPPIGVAADEVTGYENGTIVYLKNVATNGYLNLSRANDANGANVNIFEFDGTPEERWKLRYDTTDDCYRIGSYVSSSGDGRVVDVKRGGAAPKHGCNVQLYTIGDDPSQEWVFNYYGDGKYYISLRASLGLALTASTVKSSAGTYNGTPTGTSTTSPGNVYLGSLPGYDANGTYVGGAGSTIPNNQLWVIEEVNPEKTINEGIYNIRNVLTGKMMDCTSTDIMQWASDGTNEQKWKITYHDDGFYTIRPMSDLNKALVLPELTDETGANISISQTTDSSEWAKWKIIPNATGSGYRIANKMAYYACAATVYAGSSDNGAEVVQVPYCNAASQQWVFDTASVVMPTSISLPVRETLVVGDSKSLTVDVLPTTATNKQLIWYSSDTNVATVSHSGGSILGLKNGTTTITAQSLLDSTIVATCEVVVIDKSSAILSSLTRDEYYYYLYPPGINQIIGLSNLPDSPLVSTLDPKKRLLSIEICRKYNNQTGDFTTKIEALRTELNNTLGTDYTTDQATIIYTQYGSAVMSTPLLDGMPGHIYTPESLQKCQADYLGALNTLSTLVTFQVAVELNPFDANGNIKFKPDVYTDYYGPNGWIYPSNDGFMGNVRKKATLKPGEIISRYGNSTGSFASPEGTPFSARALPPDTNLSNYHRYKVLRDIPVDSGLVAPWFNQTGGGIQYKFSNPIQYYLEGPNPYLVEIY